MKLFSYRNYIITLVFTLLCTTTYTLQGQTKEMDINPYLKQLIGAPITKDADYVFDKFKSEILKFHGLTENDEVLSVSYLKGQLNGIDYIKGILLEVPHKKGYYLPLKIKVGNTSLSGEYNRKSFGYSILENGGAFDGYGAIDITIKDLPKGAYLTAKLDKYKGKTSGSPYDYTPAKNEEVVWSWQFSQATLNNTVHFNQLLARHFPAYLTKIWGQQQGASREQQERAYWKFKELFSDNSIYWVSLSTNEDYLASKVIKQPNAISNDANLKNDEPKPLGKYPLSEANVISIGSLTNNKKLDCLTGDCKNGTVRLKMEYGEFVLELINTRPITGTWTSDNKRYKIDIEFNVYGLPKRMVFNSANMSYYAYSIKGSTGIWKAFDITIPNTKNKYAGVLLDFSGKTYKAPTELLLAAYSNKINETFTEDIIQLDFGTFTYYNKDSTFMATAPLGEISFEKFNSKAILLSEIRNSRNFELAPKKNIKNLFLVSDKDTLYEKSALKLHPTPKYNKYLIEHLDMLNAITTPKTFERINYVSFSQHFNYYKKRRNKYSARQLVLFQTSERNMKNYLVSHTAGPCEIQSISKKYLSTIRSSTQLDEYMLEFLEKEGKDDSETQQFIEYIKKTKSDGLIAIKRIEPYLKINCIKLTDKEIPNFVNNVITLNEKDRAIIENNAKFRKK